MLSFFLRKLFFMVLTLWVIITITFFLMHAVPGGPFTREKELPDAVKKNIEARYHLDDPLWKQYADYLLNLLQFDLGPSFKYEGRTVNDLIREGFPVSAVLGLLAVCLALACGIPAGVAAALNQNKWQDNIVIFFSALGVSIPSFITGVLLMYVFALMLGWLPPALWESPRHMILPVLTLSLHPMAFIARLMRSSMLEVIRQDYIRTARAKGLSWAQVLWRHAMKNAMIPVVTYLGPLLAGILTGSFVVEHIFAIPGLGKHFVTSVSNRDYTVILGVTVFYSALLIVMNFLVDVSYAVLDPRIRFESVSETR